MSTTSTPPQTGGGESSPGLLRKTYSPGSPRYDDSSPLHIVARLNRRPIVENKAPPPGVSRMGKRLHISRHKVEEVVPDHLVRGGIGLFGDDMAEADEPDEWFPTPPLEGSAKRPGGFF